MTVAIPPDVRTRLEKAAADNGFDLDRGSEGGWLLFASSGAPLRVWLTKLGGELLVGLSQVNVARALTDHGLAIATLLPAGAVAVRGVSGWPALHRVLRRAWQLSRVLPDELLTVFEQKVATLPRATEAERLVVQRVGQDVFRAGLLDYWDGRCAITGLAEPRLLRASHCKPWAHCETDAERLDVFNGLLLAAHVDAAFDAGLITVQEDGSVLVSRELAPAARALLRLEDPLRLRSLAPQHLPYLAWHSEHVWADRHG